MTDVEQAVTKLRQDVAEAQRKRARAEAQRDQYTEQAEVAARALEEEFGVHSAEAGRALEAQFEAEVTAEVAQVRALLEAASGGSSGE